MQSILPSVSIHFLLFHLSVFTRLWLQLPNFEIFASQDTKVLIFQRTKNYPRCFSTLNFFQTNVLFIIMPNVQDMFQNCTYVNMNTTLLYSHQGNAYGEYYIELRTQFYVVLVTYFCPSSFSMYAVCKLKFSLKEDLLSFLACCN